jgi:zinc protease
MPEGYEYSISFHQRYYRPENCVLVLVGDFDKLKADELIHEYYGEWEPGYVPPQITPEPEQTAPREATITYPGRTKPIISVNYKSPAWSATDKIAVATEVLGQIAFGQNSDIYRKLVIQEQKLQFLRAGFGLQRDPALVSINAMVLNPDDVQMVKDEIEATVQHFRTELADEKVLADTKDSIKYGFLMGLETAQGIAFSLMSVVINTGGIEAVDEYFDTLDAITPEDIRAAAEQVLVENGRTTVTMVQAEGR